MKKSLSLLLAVLFVCAAIPAMAQECESCKAPQYLNEYGDINWSAFDKKLSASQRREILRSDPKTSAALDKWMEKQAEVRALRRNVEEAAAPKVSKAVKSPLAAINSFEGYAAAEKGAKSVPQHYQDQAKQIGRNNHSKYSLDYVAVRLSAPGSNPAVIYTSEYLYILTKSAYEKSLQNKAYALEASNYMHAVVQLYEHDKKQRYATNEMKALSEDDMAYKLAKAHKKQYPR
ncbi:hypothetical protein Dip510_000920 [Elusimicrobium posterum]|uniref:hypothetical protein n=1 Tax=Elusimicrobium posterum TaxID=3116653 RepID=UPI003C74F9BB